MERHRLEQAWARRGFTLIELLIVVAIIAILAAIAVPNFLEAQTRAKISRCRNDQRTLAVALEAYLVDNQTYSVFPNVYLRLIPPSTVDYANATGYRMLSTPVAYVSDSMPIDPFISKGGTSTNNFPEHVKRTYEWAFATARGTQSPADGKYVQYVLQGYGPDTDDDLSGLGGWAVINTQGQAQMFVSGNAVVYDPTNGTKSNGDIYRIQGNAVLMAAYGNNGG